MRDKTGFAVLADNLEVVDNGGGHGFDVALWPMGPPALAGDEAFGGAVFGVDGVKGMRL